MPVYAGADGRVGVGRKDIAEKHRRKRDRGNHGGDDGNTRWPKLHSLATIPRSHVKLFTSLDRVSGARGVIYLYTKKDHRLYDPCV